MDKIGKILKKISIKDSENILLILEKIKSGKVKNLDIKKLKGHENIFRVRSGNFRIIFQKIDQEYFILEISKRREDTYKNF